MNAATIAAEAMLTQERFLGFYRELVDVKRLIAGGDEDDASGLFARLRGEILRDSATGHGAEGARSEIAYVMAALADEVLLATDWPGRAWWESHLLEEALFGSRVSGEQVFSLAQDIVDGRLPGRGDLAMAILLTLSLGFRGRFLGVADHGGIDRLRRRLYEAIFLRPLPAGIDWATALPGAPLPVIDGGPMPRPPTARPWLLAIAASLVLYLLASHLLWTQATNGLLGKADAIILSSVRR